VNTSFSAVKKQVIVISKSLSRPQIIIVGLGVKTYWSKTSCLNTMLHYMIFWGVILLLCPMVGAQCYIHRSCGNSWPPAHIVTALFVRGPGVCRKKSINLRFRGESYILHV